MLNGRKLPFRRLAFLGSSGACLMCFILMFSVDGGALAAHDASSTVRLRGERSRELAMSRRPTMSAMPQLAVYEWRDEAWRHGGDEYRLTLQRLRASGVTQLHVDITRAALYLRAGDRAALDAYTASLKRLVRAATAQHVAVQAVAGDPSWTGAFTHIPLRLLGYVDAYNKAAAPRDRVAGLQFDIEPWALPGWTSHFAERARAYLAVVRAIATRQIRLECPTPIGFAVPYWSSATGQSRARRADTSVYVPLMESLCRLRGNYIVLMAYRNHVLGPGGSAEIVARVLRIAERQHSQVRIVAGQDVSPGPEPATSYFGWNLEAISVELARLDRCLRGRSPLYGGIVVNDLPSLLTAR